MQGADNSAENSKLDLLQEFFDGNACLVLGVDIFYHSSLSHTPHEDPKSAASSTARP